MMDESMVIDLWSDVVCPFCYLGTRQLDKALERFEQRERVTIRHRAFELDPQAKLAYGRPLVVLVANKYAIPVSQVHALHRRLEGSAEDLGMTWSLDIAKPTNTFDAHRVIALASTQGLGNEASERLFRAYFSEGELVSDHQRLSALASEVGVSDVEHLWDSDAFAEEVRADETTAQELGISGVPCFLVDAKFMLAGAQGSEEILNVLRRAWSRRAA
jgi:predicted DsbA family dithiol-disulfide isomerase